MTITFKFPKSEVTITVEASEEAALKFVEVMDRNVEIFAAAVERGTAIGASNSVFASIDLKPS